MSGCSTFGKIAHKNQCCRVFTRNFVYKIVLIQHLETVDILRIILLILRLAQKLRSLIIKNSHPTVYGLYGDTQYSFVNGYPVMVSGETHYNTYGVWMMTYNKMGAIASNCVVKMSVKANGYIHIPQAIGGNVML